MFFISFEGCEGTGKTTQIEILKNTLEKNSFDVVTIQEPGTTKLGLKIRKLLKSDLDDSEHLSEITELFMFSAARSDLISNKLHKLMKSNKIVICEEGVKTSGWGAELSCQIQESLNCSKRVFIERVGSLESPIPASKSLEYLVLPQVDDVIIAIKKVLSHN